MEDLVVSPHPKYCNWIDKPLNPLGVHDVSKYPKWGHRVMSYKSTLNQILHAIQNYRGPGLKVIPFRDFWQLLRNFQTTTITIGVERLMLDMS